MRKLEEHLGYFFFSSSDTFIRKIKYQKPKVQEKTIILFNKQ